MRPLPSWVRLVFAMGCFFIFGILLPLPTQAANTSSVMIGEVQWSGSSFSIADEWIELWNLDPETRSLAGYKLHGASAEPIIFTAEQHIPGYGTFLIANYSSTDTKSTLTSPPQFITTDLSLSNSNLHLVLFNATQEQIDEAGTGNSPPAGTSAPIHASMIRDLSSVDTWVIAEQSLNLRDTSMDRGTPGLCDGCSPTSTEPISEEPPSEENEPISEATSTSSLIEPENNSSIDNSTGGRTINATSSEMLEEQASSTLSLPEETASASSTEPDPFPSTTSTLPSETTSSTETVPFIISSSTSSTLDRSNVATSTIQTISTLPTHSPTSNNQPISTNPTSISSNIIPVTTTELRLGLNELFPAPLTNQTEWIELKANRTVAPADFIGWSLENDRQSIFRFSTSSLEQVESCGGFLLIRLKGSRLKNDGDEIHLKNKAGSLMEISRYPKITKGESWARIPDETGPWTQTNASSPCLANPSSIDAVPSVSNTQSPSSSEEEETPGAEKSSSIKHVPLNEKISTPLSSTSSSNKSKTTDKTATKDTKTSESPSNQKTTAKTPTTASTKKATTSSSTKSTSAKTTTKTSTSTPPPLIPIENLSDMSPNVRVRLTGVVGTQPGLLSSKQFVIQTEDGRGLLVTGNNQQLSPPYGSLVELTGTLRIQDQGISLSMLTADRWRLLKKEGETHTRSVELLAPSLEDQWSLVNVTGTVKEVNKTSFTFETDGTTLSVVVKPVIEYRAERLKKGDLVVVKGLLDHRTEQVKLIPRMASEINLIQHPVVQQAQLPLATTQTLPPWMPIGMAGMTIAGVQGFKKLRKVREEKRLKAALEIAGSRWDSPEDS